MLELDVNQDLLATRQRLDEALFARIAREVFQEHPVDGLIAVRFVSEPEMQMLNRMYRGKDSVTDVLSFSYMHDSGDLLGDVALSYEQAQRQAQGDVGHELLMLIVHGILHVLGYDHERAQDAQKMFPLQDRLVDTIILHV